MRPLLSIVIPTKNRYYYLKQLIILIESYKLSEYELVIQDNSDSNTEIIEFINEHNFSHLKYFYQHDPISQSANSDLAIINSTGEYVCFIGDDDGVLNNIIDCTKWMKENNIEALRPSITIFNWADFYFDNRKTGTLLFETFNYRVKIIDPIKSLKKLAKGGFTHIYTLPKVYQGIVKRTLLDRVYKIGGTFSPGPSPDMANAVALSFKVKRFAIINLPVIIIGQSKNVGGGERQLKGGVKNIDEVPFLPKDSKQNWHLRIPRVWCSQTVWPESAIKAIKYMNKESEININYEYILAEFIRTHKDEKLLGFKLTKNRAKLSYYLISFKLRRILNAINWRLNYLITGRKPRNGFMNFKENLNDIQEVNNFFNGNFPHHASPNACKRLRLNNNKLD